MTKAGKEGQRKAPILRFKGFTDDWEQRELGEIADTYSGGTPQVSVKEYYSKNEIPFIRSSDIHKDKTELYISSKGLQNSSAKLVSKGHILYALYGATSGEVDIARIEGAINQAVLCINAHDDLNYFLMLFLSKNKEKIIRKYIQGGQGNLSASIIKKIKIFITSKLEETQVSDFIKKLSNIITLYERKLQLNLKLYAELLKQFIPDKNSKSILNKINWQSISLGKIAHLQKGKQKNRNDISEVRNDKETYPVYNGGKEKSGYTDEYNRNDSIIISEGGNSAGYVNYIAGKFYSGGHNYSIEPQNIDSSLLYLILLRNQSRIMNLRTGSGLPNIKISSLKSFKIFIPSKNDNLYDFDKLLILFTKDNNLIKDKLNKLKLIKKTLLNTMFI